MKDIINNNFAIMKLKSIHVKVDLEIRIEFT